MQRSVEQKEIELFMHLDFFLLPFKQMCTLRVENENGIHLKLQNSKSWVAFLRENTWKRPEKVEIVFAEKESSKTTLEHDPYSIA